MIVTCEKCAARYKLDDAKVSGRGAKITCPRCRHVFVVYREEEKAAAAKSGPPSTLLPEDGPPPPGARPPIGSSVSVPPLGGNNAPRSSPLPTPSAVYTPASVAPQSRRDVHTLDFRKVGIASWKVRVKIGLIYDFSDYKTLRKYIQDGRVTASDLLSYDGKAWVPIGDIPDLEMYFIEVYEAAEKKKSREESSGTGADNPFADESPTAVVGMSDLAASSLAGNLATERPAAPVGGGAVSRSSTPTLPPGPSPIGGFRSSTPTLPPSQDSGQRTAGRAPRSNPTLPPQPAATLDRGQREERQGLGVGGAVVLLLAVGAVGAWAWINFFKDPPPPAPTPEPDPSAVTAPSADPEAIREQVRQELQRELENTDPPDPMDVVEEPKLIPVRPKSGSGSPGATPVRPTGSDFSSAPQASGTITQAPTSAKDHAQAGDDAWRSGDYKTAAFAYRQAVDLEPASATYQGKLGRALYRTGDAGGASSALSRAQKGGWTESSKWLGHIARDQGDDPGAIGHYNDYLKSSPSDAADIQREIDKLTGS